MKLVIRALGFLTLLFAVLHIGGCASMNDMVGHNSVADLHSMELPTTPARTYAASVDEVKQGVLFSLQESGLENVEEHQTNDGVWYVTGEIGYSWRSNGQFVRMAAQPEQQGETPRTVLFYSSVKRFAVNVTEDLGAVREKLLNLVDSYIESL